MLETDNTVKEVMGKMENKVKVKIFTSENKCVACNEALGIIKELSKVSEGKLEFEHFNLEDDKEKCEEYDVSRAPTILIPDFGIRYTGAPIGLETAPFVQTIIMASSGQTVLGDMVNDRLDKIKKKGKIRIIVTPTCPYCAQAVVLENSLAIMSENVDVEIIESYENPDLARKYNVTGVPVTIINEKKKMTGVPNVAKLISELIDDRSKLNQMYS